MFRWVLGILINVVRFLRLKVEAYNVRKGNKTYGTEIDSNRKTNNQDDKSSGNDSKA